MLATNRSSLAPGEFREGQMVGRYRLDGLLDVGGMGRIYRATGPSGTEVAVKLVKREFAGDGVFRKRFHREAGIAVRIRHPHIVPVLDAGEEAGIPYLVQRLMPGGSLAARLGEHGPLGLEPALKLCLEVAAGLDALHEADLVHRDVKPGNILFDDQGSAYITDFGLAKDSRATALTRPGQALGSLDYMAPEQITAGTVYASTDVYALGCLMYECLAGAPPFGDRKGFSIMWAHLHDTPGDPCAARPELPRALGPHVLRALEKSAYRRPASATEYALGLCAAVERAPDGIGRRP